MIGGGEDSVFDSLGGGIGGGVRGAAACGGGDIAFGGVLGGAPGNAVVSYARYLGKTVAPTDLAAFYPEPGHWPWRVVGGALVLVMGISAWVIVEGRRRPYLAVGWFWYLGMLVPVIGVVQVGGQAMAHRYHYLPSVGLVSRRCGG